MSDAAPLGAGELHWDCDPDQFHFETTDELQDLETVLGQARAVDAVEFGIGIRHDGYNLFVLGPPGTGKRTIVQQIVEKRAASQSAPDDWCYVNNFEVSHQPKALALPAGRGIRLRQDMESLIDDLRNSITAALASEEHQVQVREVEEETKDRHETAFRQLAKKAESQSIRLMRTPGGYAMAPIRDGEVLDPEDFEKLPADEKHSIEAVVSKLQSELQELVGMVPQRRKEMRDRIKDLNREAARFAIGNSFEQIQKAYEDLPKVLDHLQAVERDVIDHADHFQSADDEAATVLGIPVSQHNFSQRYGVNLLVDNSHVEGAPVIFEDHPNYQRLLGRVDYKSHMGTLETDFTLVKPGALHRANAGYLVIEALRLLQQPYAWEGLEKRALLSQTINIESLAESLSLVSTVSLEPEPIPLDVKVLLLGDRLLYYLLYDHDQDFAELFKVAADFDDRIDRSPENCRLYAQLLAMLVRRHEHRHLDRSAVTRVIEHGARVAQDSEKLTTHLRTTSDLLRESDYWAAEDGTDVISARHVDRAIDKQIYRADRVRTRMQEEIQRGTLMIDTAGERIAQVNGLSVIDLGTFSFGRPARITATARLGKGDVVDIEREVKLGGAFHSKGVLILSAFLASRYAENHPLSLSASLVFEQSYGLVDGDSASVAELCALLSSLAKAPIKQSLAVTGSINQHGQVQPIGGVNEKIEGFFDVCQARGLRGDQGVLIPAANVKHLMLRKEVVAAASEGMFYVYPVETVDQAVSLLTGVPAGEIDEAGNYPDNSINSRVAARLLEMFQLRQEYGSEHDTASSETPPL